MNESTTDGADRRLRVGGAGARVRQPVEAVVLDLDGVLIEGEEVWDAVREQLVRERGGQWTAGAQAAMMGMSSPEWSRYMARELGVPMEPAAISSETVARVAARYRQALPLVDGAVEVVTALAGRWPLGLASSANRPIIALVLCGGRGLGQRPAFGRGGRDVGGGRAQPPLPATC